jgi:hypothetical protein
MFAKYDLPGFIEKFARCSPERNGLAAINS